MTTTLQSPLIPKSSSLLVTQDAFGICSVVKTLRKSYKAVLANSSLLLRNIIRRMVIPALLPLLPELWDDIAFFGEASLQHLISPTLICSEALRLGDRQMFVLE